MLEKPDLADEKVVTCLQDEYGLTITQITFLPLGADINTAVYRAVTRDEIAYFVKLRSGPFAEISVLVPDWLYAQGIRVIIPPVATTVGELWASLDDFRLIVYPFVRGRDGYETPITESQWRQFGTALRQIHAAAVPDALYPHIPQENYSAQWRDTVRQFLDSLTLNTYTDPIAAQAAEFLHGRRKQIGALVQRTEEMAQALRPQELPLVLCHSDLHAGNLLLVDGDGLYLVDWDNPVLAPKERDLMFVGGGQMKNWLTPKAEEALFYPTYGRVSVNATALAYYRYERIVQDIAAFCEQIFLTDAGGEDRAQALTYLQANFSPHGVLEIANAY